MIPLGYKIGAGVLIGVALVTAIALSYRHYTGLVDDKAKLTAKVGTLEQDVAREKARADAFKLTIDKWDEAAAVQADALDRFSNAQREAGETTRKLTDVLSKHDLGALARSKPGLIQTRINAGTADAFRLLEQSTGAAPAGGAQAAPAARPAKAPARKD
ncbi:i-spanin [Stenotrophomonas phage vB_Sm_QDWS359]|uniref:I-spanin n=1 Tax=Stenotrophomonas phage vB_Sm_QDWS359 TaxID=2943841 RepID=A0A9E7IXG8_9CAUD|nr:i-spanin [Stenotrophomonas phage vB_Sm_QDWS359]UQM93920.1 i-spanin [Stenotrophomonas phage vB_Sm_QDWS359]